MSEENKNLTAEDLDLLDPALEDADRSDEDLWNELETGETGKPDADEPDDKGGTNADDFTEDGNKSPTDGEDAPKGDDAGKPDDASQGSDTGEADDIWANASEEQRKAFEETQKRASDLEHRLRSDDGRVSSLQRKVNRLEEDLKNRGQKGGRRDNETATQALSRLKSEYPEIAEMLDPVLENVRGDVNKLTEAERIRDESMMRDLNESRTELATIANNNAAEVEKTHPGYEEFLVKNQTAFLQWVEDQPRAIRDAAYANAEYVANPAKAIQVIDLFKKHIGADAPQPGQEPGQQQQRTDPDPQPLNDRRKRQLDASASPQRSARRPATSGVPDTDDEQAIWDALEAQESAKRA